MDDFLLGLLSVFLEVLLEALLQIFVEIVVASIAKWIDSATYRLRRPGPLAAMSGYFLLGLASGACSVLLIPHPIFHPSRFHGISLLLSPFATGLAMYLLGDLLRRRGKATVRIESFGYGFTFALGMALVRLFFTN